jgi:hypothetical protein
VHGEAGSPAGTHREEIAAPERCSSRGWSVLLGSLLAASCPGGSGGAHPGTTAFQLVESSLPEGAVWPINREFVLRFGEPVDFTMVSANTIQIRSSSDVPAIGVFRLRGPSSRSSSTWTPQVAGSPPAPSR